MSSFDYIVYMILLLTALITLVWVSVRSEIRKVAKHTNKRIDSVASHTESHCKQLANIKDNMIEGFATAEKVDSAVAGKLGYSFKVTHHRHEPTTVKLVKIPAAQKAESKTRKAK